MAGCHKALGKEGEGEKKPRAVWTCGSPRTGTGRLEAQAHGLSVARPAWRPGPLTPPAPLHTHLDFLVQQLQGQVLKRDAGPGVEAGLAEEAGDISGVPGLAPRVDVLEGLEVIVQGVPHQHLALQELEDL